MQHFNLIEGSFWLGLSLISLALYFKAVSRYRRLALFSFFVLLTFGFSDFTEHLMGSFLLPGMEWLLVWKVLNVMGLCGVVTWYFVLRLRG